MKKRVLLRAPLLTNSGYGVHSRQIFEWLKTRKDFEITSQCLSWGATPWIVNPSFENGLFREIMNTASDTSNVKFDITFQVQLPDEWDASLGRINIGVTALVETDRCNMAWLTHIDKMDHIIVPSTFTKNIILHTFGNKYDKKITVIPEWFNENISLKKQDLEKVMDERYKFDTKFNLLTIGTLTSADSNADRKNLGKTIAWALETFEGEKDVGIIVKTCLGKGSVGDREMTKSCMNQLVDTFRKSEYPKIHLIHGNMTSKEVAALFRSNRVHGYITGTRGEGYGLPIIEAAASAIPVVATNWSGHLDFLGDDFIKVDYDMQEIPESRIDNRIFTKNVKWADPKEESFKNSLIDLRKNYKDHLSVSRKLKKKIENRYAKQKICKKYDKFLRTEYDL